MTQLEIECLELNQARVEMTKVKDSQAADSKSQLEMKLNS